MKNTRRRKRCENPPRTRSHTSTRAVRVLAAGLAIAVIGAGTGAYADTIRFDNPAGPGHFDWRPLDAGTEVILSVLDGAGDQNAVLGDPGAYRHRNRTDSGSGTDVRRAGPTGEGPQYGFSPSGSTRMLFPVDAGEDIPTAAADGFTSSARLFHEDPPSGDPPSFFVEGVEAYLGVTFDLGAGFQYGWIGVVPEWITSEGVDVLALDTFAWGYETEPGVPILAGIPEPGTLAALACGAAALLAGRRRARSQID